MWVSHHHVNRRDITFLAKFLKTSVSSSLLEDYLFPQIYPLFPDLCPLTLANYLVTQGGESVSVEALASNPRPKINTFFLFSNPFLMSKNLSCM